MSMLVSDYDGTFSGTITDKLELYLNIKAINKFLENGNTFVIATGRSFESIKREIKRHSIPYNYLICNDGSTLFDKDDNILFANYITKSDIDLISDFLKNENILYNLYNSFGVSYNEKDIVEFEIILNKLNELNKIKEFINNNLSDFCFNKLFMNAFLRKDCHKDFGIKKLVEIISYIGAIYTIGNDYNDIEMLREYNGYKVLFSNIRDLDIPITPTVSTFVKKIMKNI